MKKKSQFLNMLMTAALTLGLLFVSAHLVMAKGDFAKLAVSGGNLGTEIEITDKALLGFFSFSHFPEAQVEEPEVGEGYVVMRYMDVAAGVIAWDQLHYYPPQEGMSGYVYYDGLINGSSEYDGKWYAASPEADASFQRLVTAETADRSAEFNSVWIVAGLMLAFVLAAVFAVRKRLINGTDLIV